MRRWKTVGRLAACTLLLAACGGDDPAGPPGAGEVGVVLNSVDLTLTVVSAADLEPLATVGIGAAGSPVGFALRGRLAAVPMGVVPALVVADVRSGEVVASVALPEGSGATGTAFLTDSLVLVAHPGRNTVTTVRLPAGEVGDEIPVGRYPQGVARMAGKVFVVNAELEDFVPVGPGTLTVLDAGTLQALGSVALSGENPGTALPGPDGLLYVVNSGRFGQENGSLSVVDPATLTETAHHTGFGDFPFSAAFAPDGLLYVGSFSYGVAVWDPATDSFVHPPESAVTPGGIPSVGGLGFDGEGRLHTLDPVCDAPGTLRRLRADFTTAGTALVGVCPIAIGFTAP